MKFFFRKRLNRVHCLVSFFTFSFCLLVSLSFTFEPGLESVQNEASQIEKNFEWILLQKKYHPSAESFISETDCSWLNGSYSGSYYEKKGKIYTLTEIKCSKGNGSIDVFTYIEKLSLKFIMTDTLGSTAKGILIRNNDFQAFMIPNKSTPHQKFFIRRSNGKGIVISINKHKPGTKMPKPTPQTTI